FTNKEVRLALSKSIDKDLLVHDVLDGYGVAIDSPIPFGVLEGLDTKTKSESATSSKEAARAMLEKAGWTLNPDGIYEKVARAATAAKAATKGSPATPARPAVVGQTLAFSIATADSPDLKQTAEFVKHEWEKIGAHVTIQVFEPGDLTQDVIRNRKYDAVLFGEVIGKDIDLYAFWHSSQRNAPGLNLSMYVNSKADKLLEDARKSSDESVRLQKYAAFESIIKDDAPAVFLYSPNFIYIVPEKIKGLNLSEINTAWDRWSEVEKWYVNTDSVWKFFAKNK
ncbi:MAG: hypothetical protein RIT04_602, partial [Candidatus Parcubacteria bacterium]